jgi:hypothetical protein
MQQTRQPSRLAQQPSIMDVDTPSLREEHRDAPIAPRADRERAREREQQRRSPRARVEDLTSPIHESRPALVNQGRNMYASRTERVATRTSEIQENDSRLVSPYGVSRGRDTLADYASSNPVLRSAYNSTPPSGPSTGRSRGTLKDSLKFYWCLTDASHFTEPPQGPREDPKRRKGARGVPVVPTSGSNNIPVVPRRRDSLTDGVSTQVNMIALLWSVSNTDISQHRDISPRPQEFHEHRTLENREENQEKNIVVSRTPVF